MTTLTITNISLENIAQSLEVAWAVAHEADNYHSWSHRWNQIATKLGGYHNFLNGNSTLEEKKHGGVNELLDDILWLREVVWEIRRDYQN